MPTIGPWEIGLLCLLVLLFFGPKKLPQLARGIGSSIRELKEGLHDADPRPELTEFSKPDDADEGETPH